MTYMMGSSSLSIYEIAAVALFAVGFTMLLLDSNLLKKVIGMDIMNAALFLLLASFAYIEGAVAPIVQEGVTDYHAYVNPIPSALILTTIVVSVSVSAVLLALTVGIYRRYHSLDLDKIHLYAQEEDEL